MCAYFTSRIRTTSGIVLYKIQVLSVHCSSRKLDHSNSTLTSCTRLCLRRVNSIKFQYVYLCRPVCPSDKSNISDKMEADNQLDQHVVQVDGTWQCWWLSLLDIARITGKLDPFFETQGSHFYTYWNPPTGPRAIPEVGQVPTNIVYIDKGEPIPENQVPNPLPKPERWVYGPVWQRKIMYYLLDRDNDRPWSRPNASSIKGVRITALMTLLGYLGITGITFGTPSSSNALELKGELNILSRGQNVLTDRSNEGAGSGHSMSGIVGSQDASGSPGDSIRVYNQSASKQDFVTFDLKQDSTEPKKYTLVNSSEEALTWFMAVNVA